MFFIVFFVIYKRRLQAILFTRNGVLSISRIDIEIYAKISIHRFGNHFSFGNA